MIKVGILPQIYENESEVDNPYGRAHLYTERIIDKVYDSKAIPIGIMLNDKKIDYESLKLCDAFIIGGGKKIEPFLLDIVNYCIENNKPLLGICLGMQTIAVYSFLEKLLIENERVVNSESIKAKYEEIKKQKYMFVLPVENHYKEKITIHNYDINSHIVNIKEKTKLYNIFDTTKRKVISLHRYRVNLLGDRVVVSAKKDNVIEGIEYKDEKLFIVGVQWHPELEEDNHLFEALISEAKKRKNSN